MFRFASRRVSRVAMVAALLATALAVGPVGHRNATVEADVPAGNTLEVAVAGRAGVPSGASAAALTVTAARPQGAGFLTVFPCGGSRPTASTLNFAAGEPIANSTIVALGDGGSVCVYASVATDVVVDITGWFPAGSEFTPVSPERLLDTRGQAPSGATSIPTEGVGDFVETFDGNGGLDRFVTDVFHRDDVMVTRTTWSADHDLACGTPDTQRTVRRDRPQESFYVCRDHLMTSVGDTSGYSIAWFSPDANRDGRPDVFSSSSTDLVSWDVNVTDLGARQWWEVVLVAEGTPFLTTEEGVASVGGIEPYHPDTIAVGKGPFGNDGNIFSGGFARDPLGWAHVCGSGAADPEGCSSKAIRRSFWMRDNNNGTITFEFLGKRYTYAGEFPDRFEVYFKDHNYTPDKDGVPVGHTWHWDNIVVQ
jgi:hypothetical protein